MLCVALAEDDPKEIDFFTKQARLQIEARMALAQAKDIAHMQMEVNINHNQSLAALFSSVNQFARFFFSHALDGASEAKAIANHQHDPQYGRKDRLQFSVR